MFSSSSSVSSSSSTDSSSESSASNRIDIEQNKEFELDWPSKIFSEQAEIQKLILAYLPRNTQTQQAGNYDYEYNSRLSFYGNICARRVSRVAHCILYRKWDEAKAHLQKLVATHPSLLSMVVEEKDPAGRRIKGTLLGMAIMASDFNIRANARSWNDAYSERDQGIVEMLSQLVAKHLSPDTAISQYHTVRPSGWQKQTAQKMNKYTIAIQELINDINKLKSSHPQELADKRKLIVEKYIQAISPNADDVITSGTIFDMQVIVEAIELAKSTQKKLGSWGKTQNELFWVHGIGGMQANVSAGDAQIVYHVYADASRLRVS